MVSLSRYYSNKSHIQRLLPFLNSQKTPSSTPSVSLRLIDWFVTNYAKKRSIIIQASSSSSPASPRVGHFNVYVNYRMQLKAYSKQQFDPFRRRDRIIFHYDTDKCIETTVGQLNFFRWMIQHSILEYIERHAHDIERDMIDTQGIVQKDDSDADICKQTVGVEVTKISQSQGMKMSRVHVPCTVTFE